MVEKSTRSLGYNTFSFSTQLSMKMFLLIEIKMPPIFTSKEKFHAKLYLARMNLHFFWYFEIYSQDKFQAQSSRAWKRL